MAANIGAFYPAANSRNPGRLATAQYSDTTGEEFTDMVEVLGIEEVKTAPKSPWQNPYVERVIGSIRRECLDHIIPLNEAHLRRVLREYLVYYHESRTHLSLGGNAPVPRETATVGEVISTPVLGGLHHRYSRSAA